MYDPTLSGVTGVNNFDQKLYITEAKLEGELGKAKCLLEASYRTLILYLNTAEIKHSLES